MRALFEALGIGPASDGPASVAEAEKLPMLACRPGGAIGLFAPLVSPAFGRFLDVYTQARFGAPAALRWH
jgi:hypothetical protein